MLKSKSFFLVLGLLIGIGGIRGRGNKGIRDIIFYLPPGRNLSRHRPYRAEWCEAWKNPGEVSREKSEFGSDTVGRMQTN